MRIEQVEPCEEWNDAPRTGAGREQNPSVTHDSVRQERAYDSDSEIEIEIDSSNPFFKFLKRGVS